MKAKGNWGNRNQAKLINVVYNLFVDMEKITRVLLWLENSMKSTVSNVCKLVVCAKLFLTVNPPKLNFFIFFRY